MEEEQIKTPKPKGGARKGAGRKPKDGVGTTLIAVRLNKLHVEIIKAHEHNLSLWIGKAVREKLRREGLL